MAAVPDIYRQTRQRQRMVLSLGAKRLTAAAIAATGAIVTSGIVILAALGEHQTIYLISPPSRE
jgi:hypothetical protein